MGRRAFVVVVDACGVGELPDAADYGDAGANTLLHLAQAVGGLDLPTLGRARTGQHPRAARACRRRSRPVLHGRLHALGPGKDSTAGHWELMGVVAAARRRRYPRRPARPSCSRASRRRSARRSSATGPTTGSRRSRTSARSTCAARRPIVYTSPDSVVQLAAHVSVMAPEKLYAACAALRRELRARRGRAGDRAPVHRRGRARSSAREAAATTRSRRRRPSHLDALRAAGVPVHGVGKVAALFGGRRLQRQAPGATNARRSRASDG